MKEFAVIFIIVFAAASSGAFFQPGEWYEGLRKPGWTPPNWVFPVVWTVLYLFIAIAGWLVWRASPWSAAVWIWLLQIAANAAWSWLFFGLRRMDLALADVTLLWLSIIAFMLVSWPVSQIAALLFLPYLAWVTAAALLNYSVLRLNPGV